MHHAKGIPFCVFEISKVSNTIDNGLGKGNRIAWVNTGSGLRFKVVIDRCMDIADAFYNQHSLSWLSHSGVTAPKSYTDEGLD
ncbi:MAG: DUF4432 family protein, partial [Candidatus Thorarchaeota archaeon]